MSTCSSCGCTLHPAEARCTGCGRDVDAAPEAVATPPGWLVTDATEAGDDTGTDTATPVAVPDATGTPGDAAGESVPGWLTGGDRPPPAAEPGPHIEVVPAGMLAGDLAAEDDDAIEGPSGEEDGGEPRPLPFGRPVRRVVPEGGWQHLPGGRGWAVRAAAAQAEAIATSPAAPVANDRPRLPAWLDTLLVAVVIVSAVMAVALLSLHVVRRGG